MSRRNPRIAILVSARFLASPRRATVGAAGPRRRPPTSRSRPSSGPCHAGAEAGVPRARSSRAPTSTPQTPDERSVHLGMYLSEPVALARALGLTSNRLQSHLIFPGQVLSRQVDGRRACAGLADRRRRHTGGLSPHVRAKDIAFLPGSRRSRFHLIEPFSTMRDLQTDQLAAGRASRAQKAASPRPRRHAYVRATSARSASTVSFASAAALDPATRQILATKPPTSVRRSTRSRAAPAPPVRQGRDHSRTFTVTNHALDAVVRPARKPVPARGTPTKRRPSRGPISGQSSRSTRRDHRGPEPSRGTDGSQRRHRIGPRALPLSPGKLVVDPTEPAGPRPDKLPDERHACSRVPGRREESVRPDPRVNEPSRPATCFLAP